MILGGRTVDLKWISWISLVPLSFVGLRSQQTAQDPFAILKPEIAINPDDQRTLDARDVVLKLLPAGDHELAVLAAGAINASSAKLAHEVNDIVTLKRSAAVPEIGRFSTPPALTDLAALTLDNDDVDAIQGCRPGDCALKLSPREITQLHQAANGTSAGASTDAINQEFRRIVLERVTAYLKHGLAGIPDYATGHAQIKLPTAFESLLQHSVFVREKAPQLAAYLAHYPDTPSPPAMTSSFLYWSKEKYAWKAIISVTHVTIVDPGRDDSSLELVVTSKEVFATRYTSGGLVLALLLRGDGRVPHYLVYINRAWVDGLHAFWRPFINHHLKSEARRVFTAARTRIETAKDGD